MDKPTLSPEEEAIAKTMYSAMSGLEAHRKKEILDYVTIVFREDLRARIIGLQLEAEKLSKI